MTNLNNVKNQNAEHQKIKEDYQEIATKIATVATALTFVTIPIATATLTNEPSLCIFGAIALLPLSLTICHIANKVADQKANKKIAELNK